MQGADGRQRLPQFSDGHSGHGCNLSRRRVSIQVRISFESIVQYFYRQPTLPLIDAMCALTV